MLDPKVAAQPIATPRDLRLDLFRGLCLVMIFINHVPGTVYELFTSRNYGLSDAAEGFVMMAGIAAGLAYVNRVKLGLNWQSIGRVWRRAWTLYLTHALLSLAAIGIIAAGVEFLDTGKLLSHQNFGTFLRQPLGVHIGLPLMTYQLGYVNILPMYIVLLLATPFLIWSGLRWPLATWAGSIAFWYFAGRYGWNLPNYPHPGGWFFNPLSWQLIFTTGLLIGLKLKQGKRLVPIWRWLQLICAIFLILTAIATLVPAANKMMGHVFWLIQSAGVPRIFTVFDKTIVSGPRLFHILALTYLLSTLSPLHRLAAHWLASPLLLLGRNSLPVFAAGTLAAIATQVIKAASPASFALDSLLIAGGIAMMLILAKLIEKGRLT